MSVQAQKGNKILRISEDAVERYLGMGYNIVGNDGTVITQGVPTDNNQLKLAYNQNMREIEALKAEIATLKQENERLTNELGKLEKAFEPVEETAEVKPEKVTRKRKQTTVESEEKAE